MHSGRFHLRRRWRRLEHRLSFLLCLRPPGRGQHRHSRCPAIPSDSSESSPRTQSSRSLHRGISSPRHLQPSGSILLRGASFHVLISCCHRLSCFSRKCPRPPSAPLSHCGIILHPPPHRRPPLLPPNTSCSLLRRLLPGISGLRSLRRSQERLKRQSGAQEGSHIPAPAVLSRTAQNFP